MESTQLLVTLGALVAGIAFGGLFVYFAFARRSAAEFEERAKHQYEKDRIKLESDLTHASESLKQSESKAVELEREISEIRQKLGETRSELSVANDRIRSLTELKTGADERFEEASSSLSDIRSRFAQVAANLQSSEQNLSEQLVRNEKLEKKLEETAGANSLLKSENAELSAELRALGEKLSTQKKEIEEFRQTSLREFENLATKILETKSAKFTQTNQENIQNLLAPLGKDINLFKTKVEETYDKESKERMRLDERVKALIEQTNKVSEEANNLATALKGQAKAQGNWGEVILERILEVNGLVRGREYDVQHSMKTEEGAQQYLDVIVHLPDERKLIIDSKVSLNAYERFCAAETEEDRARCLQDHLKSVSAHIDQLSAKKYDDMDSAADFVMMFVPIEPAYLVALQHDLELSKKAFAKRVLLISPTSLMIAVKMVSDLWKRDQQSKNALEIAKQGQKLYDKFVGFVSNLQDIGTHLDRSRESYDKALGQLKNGRGNLVSQAEKLKELGIKTSKTLPAAMENYEREEDSGAIIEVNPRQF